MIQRTGDHPSRHLRLRMNEQGDLLLSRADDEVEVRAQRGFPWTAPTRFITLRDDEGHEQAMIDDLADLADESRSAVEAWLKMHTFLPRIESVDKVQEGNARMIWHVRTDRGPTVFHVQEREDMRHLADGRHLIKDTRGVVYELPPLEQLDHHTRSALAALL